MSIELQIGLGGQRCTLYSRREYSSSQSDEEAHAGRTMIVSASPRELTGDARQLANLVDFLHDAGADRHAHGDSPVHIGRALQQAVERGDVIAVAPKPRAASGAARRITQPVKPRSVTFTPSQLFGRMASAAGGITAFAPALPRLAAEDGIAVWFANPGDVLPDGTIATPPSDAQPFEYAEEAVSGETEELAASTNSPKFAAKMLGYDQNTFSTMLHQFKPRNGLGPADNVIFNDDGSVEFNGKILDDNIHDYAP